MAIFTAIATAILGVGSAWIGVTAAALEVVSGIALNLIAKAVSGQNSSDATQFGVQGTLQSGGDIERSFIFGFGATAGSLVYANEWGEVDKTPNAYNTQVICVSDLPVAGAGATGLKQLYVNGTLATVDWEATPLIWGYPVLEYKKDGVDHLWIKFHDGTQTVADSFLTGVVSSTDRPYASTRVGIGCAYVVATALVNDGMFNGLPTYKFGLQGTKLYDISKDSTAGGTGSHRWATPSTWGGDGDDLPAVQMYNLLRGITYSGSWLYGMQNMQAARLPDANWIAQINKCRAPILGVDGNEPTYRSGGEVGVNATIADTATTLLTTCQGRLAEIGGTYKMYVGAPDDPVFSFDDDVILSTDEQSFTPFFGLADTINGITAKWPDPSQGWNSVVAPPLYNTSFEALDGNRRLLSDVSLDFVPYAAQVQRLMKSALLEARRARRHTIVLPPEYWGVEPGDVGTYTSVRNGYDAKMFRVDGVSDRGNLDVMVDITEVDPSDYDWTHATDFTPPIDGVLVVSRPPAQPVTGFSVTGSSILDAGGISRRPTIQMTWDGDQPDVQFLLWQVRLKITAVLASAGSIDDVQTGIGLLPPNFLPATDYQVRIKYQPFSQRATLWSNETIVDGEVVEGGWLDVTTPDIRFSAADLFDGIVGFPTLKSDVLAWRDETSRNFRALFDSVEDMALQGFSQDFANYSDHREILTTLYSTTDDITAGYENAILVATGPDSAIALQIQSLFVAHGGNDASVNVQYEASAGPAGYAARYAIVAAVDDGSYRSGSIFIDVPASPADPTRVVLMADQTVIEDSLGNVISLFDTDGAIITNLRTGTVEGPGGMSFWNLTTGAFRVST